MLFPSLRNFTGFYKNDSLGTLKHIWLLTNAAILLIVLTLPIGEVSAQANQPDHLFSVEQLKADFQFLRKKLEVSQPNLYVYTSKPTLDLVFDSLFNSISKPLTDLAFYQLITSLSSIIKDGHTVILPSDKTIQYFNQNGRFLPYHFTIIDSKLFVDMVCTADNTIPEGAEILSINDVATKEIIYTLISRQVRDGDNQTYPLWILNNYFRQYFSFIYGHPNQYSITFKTDNQAQLTAPISAQPSDTISSYRQHKYPSRTTFKKPKEGILLKFDHHLNAATLTIKDFHKNILRNEYKQNFKKVIDDYFAQIQDNKTKNLILDLRNNQGGEVDFGVFLLSYLLDKPFVAVQSYYKISPSSQQLKNYKGPYLGIHQPKKKVFTGKIYVLTNGGSFSNSGIVASCLFANRRATFIGEETGGNAHVLSGYTKDWKLPNTKIQVQIPTVQFVFGNKQTNDGRGVIPTHVVIPNLADIIKGKDAAYDFTCGLIAAEK